MNQLDTLQIKIRCRAGILKINIKNSYLPIGICKNCKKSIFWLKIRGKSFQINHIEDNKYIMHRLICPTVLAYERKQIIYKNNK